MVERKIMTLIYRVLGLYLLLRILELLPTAIRSFFPTNMRMMQQISSGYLLLVLGGTVLSLLILAAGAWVMLKYATSLAAKLFPAEQNDGIDYDRLQNILFMTAGILLLCRSLPALPDIAARTVYYAVIEFVRQPGSELMKAIPWGRITGLSLQLLLGLLLALKPEIVSGALKRTGDHRASEN